MARLKLGSKIKVTSHEYPFGFIEEGQEPTDYFGQHGTISEVNLETTNLGITMESGQKLDFPLPGDDAEYEGPETSDFAWFFEILN